MKEIRIEVNLLQELVRHTNGMKGLSESIYGIRITLCLLGTQVSIVKEKEPPLHYEIPNRKKGYYQQRNTVFHYQSISIGTNLLGLYDKVMLYTVRLFPAQLYRLTPGVRSFKECNTMLLQVSHTSLESLEIEYSTQAYPRKQSVYRSRYTIISFSNN